MVERNSSRLFLKKSCKMDFIVVELVWKFAKENVMENDFGSFLRARRQEKNLTQKELARMLFVSESLVSKWEKNVARPDIALLPRLSEILGVTEHEIITASVDYRAREEKNDARKWRTFSLTWGLFFYISYGIAILTCFICNLAVDKTLSWFWIVLSALLLSFAFTNLPSLIKRHKLILIPLSQYLALVLLLGICCIYSRGNWFFIPVLSVFFGLTIIFTPIIISKYRIFSKVKKFNDFISVAIDFVMLNILLIAINVYTLINGYADGWWYFKIAFPIVIYVYLALNIIMGVRFLKTNRFLKTSIVLLLSNAFLYLPPIFIKVKNPEVQKEIDDANIFKANLSCWQIDATLEQNIHLIVCLSLIFLALIFLVIGLVRRSKRKKKN